MEGSHLYPQKWALDKLANAGVSHSVGRARTRRVPRDLGYTGVLAPPELLKVRSIAQRSHRLLRLASPDSRSAFAGS